MSVTAVQKHVAVLEEAGLVARRREGRELRLSGRPEALRRAQDLLDAFEQVWRGRLERMADVLAADVAPVRSDPRQAAQPASAKPPSAPARPAPRSTRASRRDTP
jgi:predicted ArsR family transcriptional regulator